MHRDKMGSAAMNNSLSDLLDDMDLAAPDSKVREGFTVSTIDSIKKSSTVKKTRRGATKKESSKRGSKAILAPEVEKRMENSLSDLFDSANLQSPKKNLECLTVATMDSMGRKEKKTGTSTPKRSKRGGKKKESVELKSSKVDLERSLTDMLTDEDEDDDDYEPRSIPKESLTVSTIDSVQREKGKASSLVKKVSKRGCKKSEVLSLSLKGGPAPAPLTLGSSLGKLGGTPRDFGRHADDNDTFCGLGTVGDKELARGSPNRTKSPAKTKIAPPPMKARMNNIPSSFRMSSNDDSDSDDEEDLFQGFSGSNPFRPTSHR